MSTDEGGAAPTVAVLHPGKMGAAVAAAVRRSGARTLWCPAGRSAASTARAEAADLEAVDDLGALLAASDVVLSICPPAAAEDLADEVADRGFDGLFVDANAISPQRVERIGHRLAAAGARVVDGALFGPRWAGDPIRFYLSGEPADLRLLCALFDGPEVAAIAMDGPVGQACALKMAHSTFQKSSRALAGVAYALAAQRGVAQHLATEAAGMESALAQLDVLPSVAARAWRWVPEMYEVADELAAHGLPAGVASSAAEVFARWESDRDVDGLEVGLLLDQLAVPPASQD